MNITPISYKFNQIVLNKKNSSPQTTSTTEASSLLNKTKYANINFASRLKTKHVVEVDEHLYKSFSENMKKILRRKCENFSKTVNPTELANPKKAFLPFAKLEDLADFVKCCDHFRKLKGHPTLCLGRSPKWFLNTALWMKDGIDYYKFIPFSGAWYRKGLWNLQRENENAPTEQEILAYEKFLKSIEADPVSVLNEVQKSGQKAILTDYVRTGKGPTSFMELWGKFAQKQGVLDELGKSFDFLGFSNMEFLERIFYEGYSEPSLQLSEELVPYYKHIERTYYDVPYETCMQILENGNTNECRATYYPHQAWTSYNPNRYRTGKMPNDVLENLKITSPRTIHNFTPAMRDYRNLLNFKILDYLAQNDLLKDF